MVGNPRLIITDTRQIAFAIACRAMDGALGFWKALDEVFPGTQHQCCWGERRPGIGPADRSSLERAEPGTANVLNKVPKSIQPAVKSDLRDIPLP